MAEEEKKAGTDHVDREAVYQDWKSGIKRKDIAEKHQMKEQTVKSWIARDFSKRGATKSKTPPKKGAPKKDVGTPPKKKVGAPKGNKNAVGNKGNPQPRNQNNYRHGAYCAVYWDTLDEEEQSLLETMSYDEEQELENQIALLSIRERRLMQEIKKFKDKEGGLTVDSVTNRKLTIEGSLDKGEVQEHKEQTTKAVATFDALMKLEGVLTQIQAKKTSCVQALHRIRTERADREERKREKEQELGDQAVEDVVIYMPEKRELE